jgi:hypothetical protein
MAPPSVGTKKFQVLPKGFESDHLSGGLSNALPIESDLRDQSPLGSPLIQTL